MDVSAGHAAHPIRVSVRALESDLSPADLLSRVGGDGAVVLTGNWAGGGALVATDPVEVVENAPDPFAVLATAHRIDGDVPPGVVGGGWFGWLSFAAGRDMRDPSGVPSSRWAFYPNVLRFDSGSRRWFDEALLGVVGDAELERRRAELAGRLRTRAPRAQQATAGSFTSLTSRARYVAAIEACIEHIRAGDVYQANICLGLRAEVTGPGAVLHERLVRALEPSFGAYFETAPVTVASASPELFLRRRGRRVISSPIKGTRPRPVDPAAAAEESERLRASAKDRAENVMIVDMVRNDLARVAATGSVLVPDLLRLESHPGVWHLVSDVTATLRDDATDADLLCATFPPGSVTGAPKVRALQIIDELERSPRGLYTGAIGYRSPVAGLELSVTIRTLEIVDGTARLGAGAGITAGSQPAEEWWECFDKARPIVSALGARIATEGARRPHDPATPLVAP